MKLHHLMLCLAACAAPTAATRPHAHCSEGMVHIPPGHFLMATPDWAAEYAAGAKHREELAGYCIDRTEVTVAAYARCVAAGRCTPAVDDDPDDARFCNGARADRQDHPINCVDWTQATAYCSFAGKRIPTEAEWEYAALGGDGRVYPWGREPPTATRVNACGPECLAEQLRIRPAEPGEWISPPLYAGNDGWAATAPVGRYPAGASPFGVLDLAGNVEEWTADGQGWTGATLAEARRATRHKIKRGGHWLTIAAEELTPVDRGATDVDVRTARLGFRCVR